ncbi:MAG: caspase family protein [Candidatus Aenigmatarchaeota archaeon]
MVSEKFRWTQKETCKKATGIGMIIGGILGGLIGASIDFGDSNPSTKFIAGGLGALIGSLFGGGLFGSGYSPTFRELEKQGYEREGYFLLTIRSLYTGDKKDIETKIIESVPVYWNGGNFGGWLLCTCLLGLGEVMYYGDVLSDFRARPHLSDSLKNYIKKKTPFNVFASKPLSRKIDEIFLNIYNEKEAPQVEIQPPFNMPEYSTNAERINLGFIAIDDVELSSIIIFKDEEIFKTFKYEKLRKAAEVVSIPLNFGNNRIKLIASDWTGKQTSSNEITVFRRKPHPGERPEEIEISLPKRPRLNFNVATFDFNGDGFFEGGERAGLRIRVENIGEGKAEDVEVVLSGDDYLLKLLGKYKPIGNIEPGKIGEATFETVIPSEPIKKEARITVKVIEKGWGENPPEYPLLISLKPGAPASPPVVKPLLPAPNVFKNNRRRGYALLIGIQDYNKINDLKYARRDVEAFKDYLSGVFGIPLERINTLVDADATIGSIEDAITQISRGERIPFFVLYYSGHGYPGQVNPSTGKAEPMIVPWDFNPQRQAPLISIREISQRLENIADTALIILDACYSGKGKTPEVALKPIVNVELPASRCILFSSTDGLTPSEEYEPAQYSLFSYYLMLGLKGESDANRDGWIDLGELESYVINKVRETSWNRQNPQLTPKRDIRIGRYR